MNVVINSADPNMLPIAMSTPSSFPEAMNAANTSGAPFENAINVTLLYIISNTLLMFMKV